MYSLIFGSASVILFASLLIIGLFSYYRKNEESFSFLNEFPFELNTNTIPQSYIFNIIASLLGGCIACFGIFKFLFLNINGVKLLSDYITSVLFILIGIIVFLTFIINLNHYKAHLIVVSLLFGLTVINYAYIGVNIILDVREIFNGSLAYILLIIGAIALIALIAAPLRNWMYLEKHEEGGQISYNRQKISILPLLEWIYILLNIILIIILMIN